MGERVKVSWPAVVLAVGLASVLVGYAISSGWGVVVLFPAGTTLTLGLNLPNQNASFWVVSDGTRLRGRWTSDGPAGLFVWPYGQPFLLLLPHEVFNHCGGTLDVPLSAGHYSLGFVLGGPNITHIAVADSIELAPATGAPAGSATFIACPAGTA